MLRFGDVSFFFSPVEAFFFCLPVGVEIDSPEFLARPLVVFSPYFTLLDASRC